MELNKLLPNDPAMPLIEEHPNRLEVIVTNISFYQLVLLNTLQLATGATGLLSKGATAVVHGCSVRALGHNLGKGRVFTLTTVL